MLKEGVMHKPHNSHIIFSCFGIFAFLTTLTTVSAFILSSSSSHAETTDSVIASVTVPDVCTLSAVNNEATTHSATVEVGTYTQNIGETILNVLCNDNNGYSIYAVGYSNNTVGNTNLIGTSSNIPTGTVDDGSVSNWAMKLTPVTGTFSATILNGYDSYHTVPSTAEKVATRTSSIDLSSNSQIKTTYAVSISPSQAKGEYNGKVKYTVVHPNYSNADGTLESYPVTLDFGANTSSMVIDGISYTSSSATPNLEYGTHAISGTYPSGYEFSSWSSTGNITITDSTSASTTVNVTGTGTLTLNASEIDYCVQNGIADSNCLQKMTTSNCTSSNKTVTDARDGKTYTVKLINGQCWMTQNLRFTGTSVPSTTSNVTADKTLTYYDLATDGTSGKQCYQGTSSDPLGFTNACIKDSGSTTTGVWYNYAAATAGTVTGYSNNTAASQDICPKNWHLPTGPNTTANTDINKLVGNTTSGWQNPTTGLTAFSAVAGGYYYNGSLLATGSGSWWSATAYSTTSRYYLLYDSSSGQFGGNNYNYRNRGFFVRCVRSS